MPCLTESKCANCSAPIDINKGLNGVLRCEYCGSIFTLAKKETDAAALDLIRLGNHELDICAFDNAFASFKKAAQLDSSEPECFMGMALATHKVQYIRDTVNNCLQPICHEINDNVFTQDKNYQQALKLATPQQRAQYERSGMDIDYIKQEFNKLRNSGLDYDCFICVKVTDDETRGKTKDYKIADDIYFDLRGKGYKPFFSEREIQNRIGADYEALILYALYSSECMIVVCSNESYLQTDWVKNEYTRFLKLVADEEKESDSITIAFSGKPIERLPNRAGKLQGIDMFGVDPYGKIVKFVEEHTPEARQRRAENQGTKICLSCGTQNPAAVKFCGECGSKEFVNTIKEYAEAIRKKAEEEIRKRINENNSQPVAPETENVPTHNTTKASISDFKIENGVLIKYNGNNKEVIIPDVITSIGAFAFEDCSSLTSITIPNGVTSIGEYAFSGCSSLTNIAIPNSVTSIGDSAFEDCSSLTSIAIPNSVTSIGEYAFSDCSSLTSVKLKNGQSRKTLKAADQCTKELAYAV